MPRRKAGMTPVFRFYFMSTVMRPINIILLLLFFIAFNQTAAHSESAVEGYLCELGVHYYQAGRYEDALTEFKKALLLNPANEFARDYVNKLLPKPRPAEEEIGGESKETEEIIAREQAVEGILDRMETEFQGEVLTPELTPQVSREKKLVKTETVTEQPLFLSERLEKSAAKKEAQKLPALKVSGQADVRLGFTSEEAIWKRANYDLNERNWRVLSEAAFDQRENTYDARVFDRLRVNLDTDNQEGFNFHSNITVDPWSFTGRSDKVTVTSAGGDTAEIELKYWSNTGYAINETIYTLQHGDAINIPEIKVSDSKSSPVTLTSRRFGDTFTIPELKIHREFQPVRELWFDYQQNDSKLRFFPFAFQDQALSSDDPLRLSNNFIWWEESPWIRRWKPGVYNPAGPDFTKGYWDNSISFFARDSDGARLTNLRGFSFEFQPYEETSIESTFATPKDPWQEYSDVDNIISATRIKHKLSDNLNIGATYTNRTAFNLNDSSKTDARNNVVGADLEFEPVEGIKTSLEAAYSQSEYDLTNSQYKTESRGNAYYFSIIGRYPRRSIMDEEYGYDSIGLEKGEDFLSKVRFFGAHMDDGFDPSLSSYRETRDDEFWSRHIHFRKPFASYYSGLYHSVLKWEDIKGFRIGNGIDVGRDVLGFRVETLWKDRLDNLFDVRNVHKADGGYIETVARDEATLKVNDRLTAKALGIYHDLPKTKAGIDPFFFDPLTGRYYTNNQIEAGKDPSIKTGSLGLQYEFFDWLAVNGIWERTNDYSLGYDNFPRSILKDDTYPDYTWVEGGNTYRGDSNWLYSQQYFPRPPYPYYNIFKTGLRINPIDKMELYLDYTHNEFKAAGQADGNMNHFGAEVKYSPVPKLGCYLKYVYSRWQDLDRLTQGIGGTVGHHNFFAELMYRKSEDEDFVLQYGEFGRSLLGGGIVNVGLDPYAESLQTIDTEHIIRLYYSRRF